jgi:4'-phosphopantetheinyl transferase
MERAETSKPRLATEDKRGDLRFNLSHFNELALFAVTRGRQVVVDFEWIRAEVAEEDIAERFFSRR